ncbi:MAG: H-NS histone family protein [Comamonas sp.]|jgi:DNA-binding protein H-NS|uniref:H-NS histone family protein n=1 Tax=Comamonas sp. TaxID=34028 RepID=UPI0028187170|nr:H-NS histone family protein [Comamonas sp.]MDR0215574.1 H-NS histone family protein [Comamonas sp.]
MTTPTATYTELLKQHAALEQQIAVVREAEIGAAVRQARALIEEFGLTQTDVFPTVKSKREKHQGAPKYRDPVSGRTWTGWGRQPEWIKGQDFARFEIQ